MKKSEIRKMVKEEMQKTDKFNSISDSFINEINGKKSGYILDPQNYDPKNPELVVSGFGTYTLEGVKKRVINLLKTHTKRLETLNAYDDFYETFYGKFSAIQKYIEAILDVQQELKRRHKR